MPNGYNVLNSTDPPEGLRRSPYLSQLAERREREEVRQLTSFGLTMGWLFTLLGGFCWFCVISQIDWFWRALMTSGLLLLVLGTVLPQALAGPHRLWMGLAHLQGRLVMTVLLTVVYLVMIVPLGWYQRRRQGGGQPFYRWDPTQPASTQPSQNLPAQNLPSQNLPAGTTAWETLSPSESSPTTTRRQTGRTRSLVSLLAETLSFFAQRGHYLLLPVLLFLLLLGLILFFVQTSALAPFIYTIGSVVS